MKLNKEIETGEAKRGNFFTHLRDPDQQESQPQPVFCNVGQARRI